MNRETLVQQGMALLAARYGHIWETDSGSAASGAAADEPCSFTDAGDAPLTWLDTALQRSPATPSKDVPTSDLRSNLDDVKPLSEGIASQ